MGVDTSRVLVLSDMHHPFAHPDLIPYLKKIKEEFKPTYVVCIGDEIDGHSYSFHNPSAELFAPAQELELAIERLKPVYDLFPHCSVVDSNHGSLLARKIKINGLPISVLRSHKEIIEAPAGWSWTHDLVLNCGGKDVYFHHGMKSNVTMLSKNMSMCAVQGHYHSRFKIEYWSNPNGLFWGFQVGCLISPDSLAFEYGRNNMDKPIIGCGIIIEGHPVLLPMELDEKGRWTGRII